MKGSLHFLHISDLHFRTDEQVPYDPHIDVKAAALADIRESCSREPIDGLFVTGDIAYSGQAAEYELVGTWFQSLMEAARCDPSNLRCVPGNHDVDRTTYARDRLLSDAIDHLRMTSDPYQASNALSAYVRSNGAQVLSAFRSYNAFARPFSSDVSDERLPNLLKSYELNDLSTLNIYGLHSAILSTERDNTNEGRLLLGGFQLGWRSTDGMVSMTLCHHVPSVLADSDLLENVWLSKASIQLFGHTHEPRDQVLDEKCYRITAGSLYPPPDEKKTPYYNYLTMKVESTGGQRRLAVTVSERRWESRSQSFVEAPLRQRSISLTPWRAPQVEMMIGIAIAASPPPKKEERSMSRLHSAERLVTDFLRLDDSTRNRLLRKYGCDELPLAGTQNADAFIQIFIDLEERDQLSLFLQECAALMTGGQYV